MTTKEHLESTLMMRKVVLDELSKLNDFLTLERINDQFYRRLLIRVIYSIIETYLHIIKEIVKIKFVVDKGADSQITWQELVILNQKQVFLNEKGEIKIKGEFQKFESSFRFSLNIFSKEFNSDPPNYGDNNYDKLIKLSRRRNDITHPKTLNDLLITDQEIKDIMSAFSWFMHTHDRIDKGFLIWLDSAKNRNTFD